MVKQRALNKKIENFRLLLNTQTIPSISFLFSNIFCLAKVHIKVTGILKETFFLVLVVLWIKTNLLNQKVNI